MKFTINSIQIVDADLYGYEKYPDRYQANPMQSHKYEAKQLFVKGVLEDGTPARFYSPRTLICHSSGIINFKYITSAKKVSDEYATNGWFECIETKKGVVHKNPMYYEGAKASNPPAYLEMFNDIPPAIKIGDTIDIKYRLKGHIGKEQSLSHVKILK